MPTQFDLFTCNYSGFDPAMGTPVQASNGKPRYKLKFDLIYAAKEVYPPWALVKSDASKADFEAQYRAALDKVTVEEIGSRLRAIATAVGPEGDAAARLVLLCYEDLAKGPENWCHRSMFARWWTDQTGEAVRELGNPPATPEATLF